MKKLIAIAMVLVMAAATVAGCSSEKKEPAPSAKTSIVYAQSLAITSLDPAGMQPQGYPSGYEAAFAVHNGLIKFDQNLKFIPDLAESWTTSENGLEWTFNLKKGVKFHDGTDFNADAVVTQFTRMIDKKINIGAYSLWQPIVKTEKVDDYTVKITTSTPYSGFLNVMAHGSALIPSPKAVAADEKNYGLKPVGTGPYKVEKFEPGTELVLARNENYYEGKPAYEKVTFRYVGDASARVSALKSGQADIIDAVPVEFANDLKSDSSIELMVKPGLQVFGVGLNQNNEILRDKTVRHALNYAIDKEAIVKVLLMGYGTPLTSPLAPNTTGSVKLNAYQADSEKAKKMLADAGWKAGADGILEKDGKKLEFTLITPEGMYLKDVILCETLQNQLKNIGVKININKIEKATYWDQLKVPSANTKYDMALWGYNPSHGNGQIHLESLFTSNADAAEKPGLWNFIWYKNDQVDKLLKEAKAAVNADKFAATMKEAQEIIWEESPYIWLYSNNIISAKKADIPGVTVLPVVFTLVHR